MLLIYTFPVQTIFTEWSVLIPKTNELPHNEIKLCYHFINTVKMQKKLWFAGSIGFLKKCFVVQLPVGTCGDNVPHFPSPKKSQKISFKKANPLKVCPGGASAAFVRKWPRRVSVNIRIQSAFIASNIPAHEKIPAFAEIHQHFGGIQRCPVLVVKGRRLIMRPDVGKKSSPNVFQSCPTSSQSSFT